MAGKPRTKTITFAICTHFIPEDGQITHLLLGFHEITGPKSGENISRILLSVIEDYEIVDRIGAFMMDNARDNDTMLASLAKIYPIDAKSSCLRRLGHIINLVVKALLFGKGVSKLERALAGASNNDEFKIWLQKVPLVSFTISWFIFSNPPSASANLKPGQDAISGGKKPIYQAVSDGGIQWNSSSYMIDRGLMLRNAIDLFQQRYKAPASGTDLTPSFLTPEDWKALEQWQKILADFRILTATEEHNAKDLGAQGAYGLLIGVVTGMAFMYEAINHTIKRVDEMPDLQHHEFFYAGLVAAQMKLTKYFNLLKDCDCYYSAVALHPAYRLDWFEDKWQNYDKGKWVKDAKAAFRGCFERYAIKYAESEAEGSSEDEEEETKNPYIQYIKLSDDYRARKRRWLNRPQMDASELDRYIRSPSTKKDRKVLNPIEWWLNHQAEYPISSRMAPDILSIPSMSAEIERAFSQAKKLVTDERN